MTAARSSPQVYVSTAAFGSDVSKAVKAGREYDLAIEFGSGIPYWPEMAERYENIDIPRIPHNYFPAPKNPFVLNLASQNEDIRVRSVKHCLQGLRLAKRSGAPFYAAHAGFCVDPHPSELGGDIEVETEYDKEMGFEVFRESVLQVAQEAEKVEVPFLIENNVVLPENADKQKNTPLLCSTPSEIRSFMRGVDHSWVGLLLDTGHLKVSARTLGFNLEEAVEEICSYVRGIHHSDNDALRDSNRGLTESYWFLPFIEEFRGIPHVLEVADQSIDSILRQVDLITRALTNT
jgi:sugar phosphate isomerase/epimerase